MPTTEHAARPPSAVARPEKRDKPHPRRLASRTVAAEGRGAQSPEALLARASAGDREALLEIYDGWAPRVLGVIRRSIPDVEESERVLEDVFAQLWRDSARVLAAGVSVAAWLMLTARARGARRLLDGPIATQPKPSQSRSAARALDDRLAWLPSPEAIARIDDRRILLQKILGQLPRHQIKALELLAYAGRSEFDLGEDLGEPLARVRAELRAAANFMRHRRRAVVGSWTVNI